MRSRVLTVLSAAACLTVLLVPAIAEAQRRGPVNRVPYRPSYTSFYVGFGGPFLFTPWGYPYHFGYYQRYPYYWGAPPRAAVRIEVAPKTAAVYVDGVYAGVVDDYDGYFQRLVVSPGGHEITVYQTGFRSLVRRLYMQLGTTAHIKGRLEPLPPGQPDDPLPQPPPEVQGQVAGENPPPQVGPPAQQPQPPRTPLPRRPGEPARPGEPGRPAEPARPFEPGVPSPEGFGQLVLRWQPADATLLVDGEPWTSSAPGERLTLHLTAGFHRVEIRKEGFLPYSQEVQVRPGETTALNVSLTERR